MTTLTHTRPALQPVIVQINVDISLVFWPLFALAWLGWRGLARLGRIARRVYEIIRAVIVVSGRRFIRRLKGNLRLLEWQLSGLLYGPVMGVG